MTPFVDIHCHLLAGLDDGPRTEAQALEMCRIAFAEGTRFLAAGAHQSERWPAVTPERIRLGTQSLAQTLRREGLPLTIFPCAEVMVHADVEDSWKRGELLSVADRGQYLLLELPHGLFLDLCGLIRNFREMGVRPILAHPERFPELLYDAGQIERHIAAGGVVQVSSRSITHPSTRQEEMALKDWFKRGIVHLVGSDGHSPQKRLPRMAKAHERIARWTSTSLADRVCSSHGLAILSGLPFHVPTPRPQAKSWFAKLW